ncbi:hypothetical protein DERP_011584 [Dermatophagoides pteronyssinus]|uniref:Uncharacterized protein n=1 Tax=Dermatophagoides pteronyssinus TaxID=6956 RepID=A0ABQ8JWQ1_DERPT|nr:hypothetical protein DERP_011584 [Dermatophagoides pteronyssinus]
MKRKRKKKFVASLFLNIKDFCDTANNNDNNNRIPIDRHCLMILCSGSVFIRFFRRKKINNADNKLNYDYH